MGFSCLFSINLDLSRFFARSIRFVYHASSIGFHEVLLIPSIHLTPRRYAIISWLFSPIPPASKLDRTVLLSAFQGSYKRRFFYCYYQDCNLPPQLRYRKSSHFPLFTLVLFIKELVLPCDLYLYAIHVGNSSLFSPSPGRMIRRRWRKPVY